MTSGLAEGEYVRPDGGGQCGLARQKLERESSQQRRWRCQEHQELGMVHGRKRGCEVDGEHRKPRVVGDCQEQGTEKRC